MEKNVEMLSLADALRDGASLEDIRKSFEAALQDAQSEVVAEKKKAQEAKACEKCGGCDELDLDVCRAEMVYAVLNCGSATGTRPVSSTVFRFQGAYIKKKRDPLTESLQKLSNYIISRGLFSNFLFTDFFFLIKTGYIHIDSTWFIRIHIT